MSYLLGPVPTGRVAMVRVVQHQAGVDNHYYAGMESDDFESKYATDASVFVGTWDVDPDNQDVEFQVLRDDVMREVGKYVQVGMGHIGLEDLYVYNIGGQTWAEYDVITSV